MFWKKFEKIFVILFLGVFLALNLYLASTDAQTIDEGVHISAGYSYLKTGDFRMNPEHPPLVKELAALPLLFVNPRLPLEHESWENYNQWEFGRQFLYHNRIPADKIIFLGRLGPIFLGLILGFFIYKWAKELFGLKAGLFALFLYALSPNFIAHTHLITTDVPMALFFLLSIYYFGKYLKNPDYKNLFLAALVFALALNTKHSAVLIIPVLIIIYLLNRLLIRDVKLNFKKFIIACLIFSAFTVLATFTFYSFEIKTPLKEQRIVELYQEREEIEKQGTVNEQPLFVRPLIRLADPETKTGGLIKSFAENFPVPAYSYWRGFFSVLAHNSFGHSSYLLGQAGKTGWWYYFIVAFLVKTPLSTLLLLFLLLVFLLNKLRQKLKSKTLSFAEIIKNLKFDYWLLFLPPFIYFAWSLTSHINLGVRHIFPVYPFIFIGLSSLINIKTETKKKKLSFKILLIAVIVYYLFTNLAIFPYYLSYFNEAIGGAKNGHHYLLDSNLDWGQDFKRLKKYLEENNIKEHYALNFGSLETGYYLKNEKPMPDSEKIEMSGIRPGYYAISASVLFDPTRNFGWPKDYPPLKKIGYSIYVYKFPID